MLDFIEDNTLIITNNSNKDYLLRTISEYNKIYSIKIMTINEFISSYYYTYDEKTIYYLMNKYNIKSSVARIYLNNMYLVKENSNIKINNIYNMKQELIKNNLLYSNDYFKNYLKNKNIVIYGLINIPNIIKNILDYYQYKIINKENKNYKHVIYEFDTLDKEVSYVAYKCSELISNGVDINKIYLTNLNDEYRLIIKRIFSMFNIPVSLKESYSLFNTHTAQLFLENYNSDISITLEYLEKNIKPSEKDNYIRIVNICNKYVWCDDYNNIKSLIIDDLKNTNIYSNIKTNTIREINIDTNVLEDDYIFLLSFNQGIIPVIYKDEDYFNDLEKNILGIETSIDNNYYEKEKIKQILGNINNLIITYKLKTLTDSFSISNINEELNYEIIKCDVDNYNYSNLYNKIKLCSGLDLYNKYGTINDNLKDLYNNYKDIEYRKYDNNFKGIDKNDLYKYLNNKLLLSYSSLDNYNRCNFRYYLNNILKVTPYEETFMQFIGNLFHYVLSKAFVDDFNYDEVFDNYIDKNFSKKELFFIGKLKQELKFIIDTISEHNNHCSLKDELYEDKVYIDLTGNIKVTFMGIIDKLKYSQIDDRYIVAIIDYKTGNPNLNLNNVIYGIEMQLPVYIFLTQNNPRFNKIEVAGFYLQKILNNEISADKKHSYDDLKKKNLLLQGYSNENVDILKYFDDSYDDSKVIKSLKTTSKGFYSYSKVINNSTIDKLVEITKNKIQESSDNILNGMFDINPKKIGNDNLGCEFCKFKDICFRTEKNIVDLKEYKNLEFLGGDDNA